MEQGPRRATILDVAREAGMSRTTVSNALNGNGRMREDTRRTVFEAAERLGFRASRVATALRTTRTGILAVSIPAYAGLRHEGHRDYSDFYMRFVYSATLTAVENEFHVLVVPDLTSTSDIRGLGVDGVILCDPNGPEPRAGFDTLVVERLSMSAATGILASADESDSAPEDEQQA